MLRQQCTVAVSCRSDAWLGAHGPSPPLRCATSSVRRARTPLRRGSGGSGPCRVLGSAPP